MTGQRENTFCKLNLFSATSARRAFSLYRCFRAVFSFSEAKTHFRPSCNHPKIKRLKSANNDCVLYVFPPEYVGHPLPPNYFRIILSLFSSVAPLTLRPSLVRQTVALTFERGLNRSPSTAGLSRNSSSTIFQSELMRLLPLPSPRSSLSILDGYLDVK